jgi:hypothetical protein
MFDTTAKIKQVGYPRLFSFPVPLGSVALPCAAFDPSPSRLVFRSACWVAWVLFCSRNWQLTAAAASRTIELSVSGF